MKFISLKSFTYHCILYHACMLIFLCRYTIASISPSRVNPLVWNGVVEILLIQYLIVYILYSIYCKVFRLFENFCLQIGVDSSYEILCKAFSDEAKAKLEVFFIPFCC